MKKVLFFAVILVVAIFIPVVGRAATVELNITISHVYIPERAGMILSSDRPNTEFRIHGGLFSVTNGAGTIVRRYPETYEGSTTDIYAGRTFNFSFPYTDGAGPYNLYVNALANYYNALGSTSACLANCSSVPAGSGHRVFLVYYFKIEDAATPWKLPTCPNFCSSFDSYRSYIAYPDSSNTTMPGDTSYGYWKSPSILTIQ